MNYFKPKEATSVYLVTKENYINSFDTAKPFTFEDYKEQTQFNHIEDYSYAFHEN